MITWLQKKYNLNQGDTSQKLELETLRQQIQEYRKKYKEDKEMEVSSESDEAIDEEEQKLGRQLKELRRAIMKKYEGVSLEKIQNNGDRRISKESGNCLNG